jgi:hypothetical protein
MRKCFVAMCFCVIVIGIMFGACNNNSSTGPEKSDSAYKTVTINHHGFDFSASKADTVNYSNNDGYTTFWSPAGGHMGEGIWFSTFIWPNRTQNKGNVDIHSITSIDTTAAAWDLQPSSLAKNNVVVAQCIDGFVKFQVMADVDTTISNFFWAVQVKYLFSTKPSFTE